MSTKNYYETLKLQATVLDSAVAIWPLASKSSLRFEYERF